MGGAPVFRGSGKGDLVCRCGASVLVQGYLPANFVAIRFRCFRCGGVTTTPGLPEGEILPRFAASIAAAQQPMVTTSVIGPGDVLACREAIAGAYGLTRPDSPPDEPLVLSHAMLEAAAADYDRLAGGELAQQIAASPPAEGPDHGPYPFAWSVSRLRPRIGRPGWSWLLQDDDAMAAMYVTAMHHLMLCWGRHPLLPRLAAPLVRSNRFIPTVATLATAKLLFDSGNRVGFSCSDAEVDLHF